MLPPFSSRFGAVTALLLAAVLSTACAPGASDADAPASATPGATSSGATGKFYRRTNGTTALALNGSQSYFCSWDDCPGGVTCGMKVYGNDKGTAIDWQIPTSSTATATTTMDVSKSGTSLTLTYQGARVGDYTEVASWSEAARGDNGYCGGSTGSTGAGAGTGTGAGSGGTTSGGTTGRIGVWTSRSSLPQAISVSIDGSSVGSLSTYFTSAPTCGDAGTITRTVSAGLHQVTASAGASMSWGPSSVSVSVGGCAMMQLN